MKTTIQQLSQKLQTEEAVHFVKAKFEKHLKEELSLVKVRHQLLCSRAPVSTMTSTALKDR